MRGDVEVHGEAAALLEDTIAAIRTKVGPTLTRCVKAVLPALTAGPPRKSYAGDSPGMMPRLISGWPKRARSEQMRMWQAMASSIPPPRQKPLIIAITGLGKDAMTSKILGLRMA